MLFDDESWFSMTEEEYEGGLQLDALAFLTDLLADRYCILLEEIDLLSWAEHSVMSSPQYYSDQERLALATRMLRALEEYRELGRLWEVVEEIREPHRHGH